MGSVRQDGPDHARSSLLGFEHASSGPGGPGGNHEILPEIGRIGERRHAGRGRSLYSFETRVRR